MFEATVDDAVDVAREHLGDVADGLAPADADLLRAQVDAVAAEVGHGDLEANASPEGGFFEEEGDGLALQRFGRVRVALDVAGACDEGTELRRRQVGDGKQVFRM